jgi:hypothetical protein
MRNRAFRHLALTLLLVLGSVGISSAAELTISVVDEDTQLPVQGASVKVYLSYALLEAETGIEGLVSFDNVIGRGFWVEIDGERQAEFYYTENSPIEIRIQAQGGAE